MKHGKKKQDSRKAKVRSKFVEQMNAVKKGGMKAPIKDTLPEGQSDSEDC